jgi:hypothetical protein
MRRGKPVKEDWLLAHAVSIQRNTADIYLPQGDYRED